MVVTEENVCVVGCFSFYCTYLSLHFVRKPILLSLWTYQSGLYDINLLVKICALIDANVLWMFWNVDVLLWWERKNMKWQGNVKTLIFILEKMSNGFSGWSKKIRTCLESFEALVLWNCFVSHWIVRISSSFSLTFSIQLLKTMPFKHFPVINYIYCCYLHMACLENLENTPNAHNDISHNTTHNAMKNKVGNFQHVKDLFRSEKQRECERANERTLERSHENWVEHTQSMRQFDAQHLFV